MIKQVLDPFTGLLPELWNSSNTPALANAFYRIEKCRLVIVPDAPERTNWGTSEIKTITGNSSADQIIAKKLFADARTFQPKFVVFGATNGLPQIDPENESVWRRVRIIPFKCQRSLDSQQGGLEKLADPKHPDSIASQILFWVVEGARKFLNHGRLPEVAEAMVLAADSAKSQHLNTAYQVKDWIKTYTTGSPAPEYLIAGDVVQACQRYAKSVNLPVPTDSDVHKAMANLYGTSKNQWIKSAKKSLKVYTGCSWMPGTSVPDSAAWLNQHVQ
jgi:phage/plasmid-associated DNA primase